jgi:hypothetical protein
MHRDHLQQGSGEAEELALAHRQVVARLLQQERKEEYTVVGGFRLCLFPACIRLHLFVPAALPQTHRQATAKAYPPTHLHAGVQAPQRRHHPAQLRRPQRLPQPGVVKGAPRVQVGPQRACAGERVRVCGCGYISQVVPGGRAVAVSGWFVWCGGLGWVGAVPAVGSGREDGQGGAAQAPAPGPPHCS